MQARALTRLTVTIAIVAVGLSVAQAGDWQEFRVHPSSQSQQNPDIWGNTIVWQDGGDGRLGIWMYDLVTGEERRITTPAGPRAISIHDKFMAWMDNRDGNLNIYMYDLKTNKEKRITRKRTIQLNPKVYGNTIVWFGRVGPGNMDVYMYNLTDGKTSVVG
jgi:beta propeller repeat protein